MTEHEQLEHVRATLKRAVDKLKKSMDTGPAEYGGEPCELTSNEATIVWRMLVEHLGVKV